MSIFNQFFPGASGLTVRPPKKVKIPGMAGTTLATDGNALPCRDVTGNYVSLPASPLSNMTLYRKSDATVIATIKPADYVPAAPTPPKASSTGYWGDYFWYDDVGGYFYALLGYPWSDGGTMRYNYRLAKISDTTGAVTFPGTFLPSQLNGVLGNSGAVNSNNAYLQGGLLKVDMGTGAFNPVTGADAVSAMTLANGKRFDLTTRAGKWLSPDGTTAIFYQPGASSLSFQTYVDTLQPKYTLAPDYQLMPGRLWMVEGRAILTANTVTAWRFYDGADLQRYFNDLMALASGGF